MFSFDSRKHPNGTILILGITYADRTNELEATRGRTEPKVFTYVFLKAGNLWYSTGGPKAPTAAGWPAVERWLSREGRTVAWASIVTQTDRLYSGDVVKVDSRVGALDDNAMERRAERLALEPGLDG